MPFDRFTIEQLAGDLLPKATSEQIVATGFNRCNVSTSEGGSIDAEWIFRNAVDRASTTMEVFLGLTGGCAVCHDHKFDPITAKDFYSMYAFFYSIDGPAMDGNALLTAPTMKTPTKDQEKKLADLAGRLANVQTELGQRARTLKYTDPADLPPEATKFANDPTRSLKAWRMKVSKDNKGSPKDIVALVKQAKLDAAGENKLRDYYLQNVCADTKPMFDALNKQLATLTKERDGVNSAVPGTFIFKDLPKPRESFVMMRGQYTKPGEKVEPNTPGFLPPLAKSGQRANRLDLAKWLVSPEQPMTARVAVNRYWQQFFGTGLVKSSGDFGSQGDLPSHPELLDFLSIRFRESGWDVKAMVRLMLTSQTFRQSAKLTAELYKRDPDNRLYARGPRIRLDAEQIRDNALYVSGLMVLDMGGRGVKPYQPPRIWEPVAFSGSNTGNYVQDKGAGTLSPQRLHVHQTNRAASVHVELRCPESRITVQPPRAQQHAAASVATDERRAALRSRPQAGRAHDRPGRQTPEERIRFGYRVVLAREPEVLEADIVAKALASSPIAIRRIPRRRGRRCASANRRYGLGSASRSWRRTR